MAFQNSLSRRVEKLENESLIGTEAFSFESHEAFHAALMAGENCFPCVLDGVFYEAASDFFDEVSQRNPGFPVGE